MIEHIHIRNFKRFEDQEFELTDRAVLVGPNNSGKTTLLQAINVWCHALSLWTVAKGGRPPGIQSGIAVSRLKFSALPIRDLQMLWTDNSTALTGDEGKAGSPRVISITAKGRSGASGKGWTLTMEFRYANAEVMYVKPSSDTPVEAVEETVSYVPSLSGIDVDEKVHTSDRQDWLIGQGKPGDLLRNLLLETHARPTQWERLNRDIEEIFGCRIMRPDVVGRPFVLSEYEQAAVTRRSRKRTRLDLSSSGSGFMQTLSLLAFLHGRPASIVLLDEPDAHLHVWLQEAVHDRVMRLVEESGSQVVVATHSEVLINATQPGNIVSFHRKPRLLKDRAERDRAREALKRFSTTDAVMAESGRVLYVEGPTDVRFLLAWADALGHPIRDWLSDHRNRFVIQLGGRNAKLARDHFFALMLVNPDMRGFILVDRDSRGQKPVSSAERLEVGMWGRYEIENYLLLPDVIRRFLERHAPRRADAAMDMLRRKVTPAFWADPATDEFAFQAATSKQVFPGVLSSAGLRAEALFSLAREMRPEEIHPDIKEMLDRMAEHFGIADT